MKRWAGALVLAFLACLAILLLHARGEVPPGDIDTWVMLRAIRDRSNPFSWFLTDWPLQNGFYRPMTALSYELDVLLFPASTSGYGLSAAIYCAVCVLGVFWVSREQTDSPLTSAMAAVLFAFWHTPFEIRWDWISWCVAALILIVGGARHRRAVGLYLPAALAVTFVATELRGIHLHEAPSGFLAGVMHWLPSRTATVMTMFCLFAIGSYARYMRLTAVRADVAPQATDKPATRSSTHAEVSRFPLGWLLASYLFVLLALGSYEQAVMLPPVLFVVALAFRVKRDKNLWTVTIFFIELLFYLALRREVLPMPMSGYVDQQLRSGVTAYLSALNYILPCIAYAASWISSLSVGSAVLILGQFYSFPFQVVSNVTAYVSTFRRQALVFFLWLCSVVAFLPMAFLKPFSHYHYWPMALRSIFVIVLISAVGKLIAIAVSPRTVQAPQRLSPAPGSLRHP